jgi:uncharacterized membrane protein
MSRSFKITWMKTATYAVMHLLVAIAVAYALTGSWGIALAIGLIEPAVQTVAFAIHERIWARALTNDAALRSRQGAPDRGRERLIEAGRVHP